MSIFAGGLGKIRHREFAMASGEMSRDEFMGCLRQAMQNLVSFSADGSDPFSLHGLASPTRLIELDPLYVDVAIRRWQKHAKDDPRGE